MTIDYSGLNLYSRPSYNSSWMNASITYTQSGGLNITSGTQMYITANSVLNITASTAINMFGPINMNGHDITSATTINSTNIKAGNGTFTGTITASSITNTKVICSNYAEPTANFTLNSSMPDLIYVGGAYDIYLDSGSSSNGRTFKVLWTTTVSPGIYIPKGSYLMNGNNSTMITGQGATYLLSGHIPYKMLTFYCYGTVWQVSY